MIEGIDFSKKGLFENGIIRIMTEEQPPVDELNYIATFEIREDIKRQCLSYGFFLPKGLIFDSSELVLTKDDIKQEAQFDVTAYHLDKSIKSVLITSIFSADYEYSIMHTKKKSVILSAFNIYEDENYLIISDRYIINKYKAASLNIDNQNGNILAAHFQAQLLSHEVIREAQLFKYKIVYVGPLMIEIETIQELNGLPKITTNYRFYKYSEKADITITLTDDRPQPSNKSFDFENDNVKYAAHDIKYTIKTNKAKKGFLGLEDYLLGAIDLTENYQNLLQDGYRALNKHGFYSLDKEALADDGTGTYEYYTGAFKGERACGLASINNDYNTSILCKDFWQEWPKSLDINDSSINYSMFPHVEKPQLKFKVNEYGYFEAPNVHYHQREGSQDSWQLQIWFDSNLTSEQLISIKKSYDNEAPLFILIDPSYHDLEAHKGGASDEYSVRYDEGRLNQHLLYSKEINPARNEPYGWRDYGDHQREGFDTTSPSKIAGFYNGSHIGAIKYAIQYMRTLEPAWWLEVVKQTRHFMDHDISHSPIYGRMSAIEPLPAGMVKCIGHKNIDHDGRNLHDGHMHMSGLIHYYMLTGDRRAYRAIQEIQGYIEHVSPYLYELPRSPLHRGEGGTRNYIEAERDIGWMFDAMNQITEVTGDLNFHQSLSANLAQFLVDWIKTPADHYQADNLIQENCSFANSNGYLFLDEMDNGISGKHSNGCQPWMFASIATSILNFIDFGHANQSLHDYLMELLSQCYKHILKYGYDSSVEQFVYSEVRRSPDPNGARLLISPMIDYYMKAHQWYKPFSGIDTKQLGDIINYHGQQLINDEKKRQRGGDYGYEDYYDFKFWSLWYDFLIIYQNSEHTIKTVLKVSSDNLPEDSFLYQSGLTFPAGVTLEVSKKADPKGIVKVNEFGILTVETDTKQNTAIAYRIIDGGADLPGFKTFTFTF